MENRKGNGIFLGIVSVATLIVAIIGATFAFFSATTNSDVGAVGLEAYEFKLSLSMNQIWPAAGASTKMIPLNPTTVIPNAPAGNNTNLLYAINVAEDRCIDSNGLQVCALYEVIIKNDAPNAITLTGQIRTETNTPRDGQTTGFQNLTYQEVAGNTTSGFTLVGDPITLDHTPVIPDEVPVEGQLPTGYVEIGDIEITGATLAADGRVTTQGEGKAYILIYLNENGDQSSEMGASYTGTVIYASKEGTGNTLTGTFKVAAPEDPENGE